MIYISRTYLEQIYKQAKDQFPNECCGMLAGKQGKNAFYIERIFPMFNVDQSPEHFSMDPQEQFKVYYAIRDLGLEMLGNYHSHPATPARPSQEDIRLAYDPQAIYLIVSLKEHEPVLKGFYIENGSYTEIPMSILNDNE